MLHTEGHFGAGFHEYEITQEEFEGFGKACRLFSVYASATDGADHQSLYANTITYGPAAYLTKITLLLITARVFHPYKKTVRCIYVFIFGMLGYYIPIFFVKIRMCDPITALWDKKVLLTARCFNQ